MGIKALDASCCVGIKDGCMIYDGGSFLDEDRDWRLRGQADFDTQGNNGKSFEDCWS
jgi:hypothetical protein